MEKDGKIPQLTLGQAFIGFLIPMGSMILLILNQVNVAIAMMIAVFLLAIIGVIYHFPWASIESAMNEGISQVSGAIIVMMLVGLMVASWLSSGTIPALLYYGMKFINPQFFLPICFLLTAFIATCTGTSWGAISTIGVVLCGMSEQLGVPIYIAAGAVISGAFFGDKMSPLSDTTLLASASSECSIYDLIVAMCYTTFPATLICLVLYYFLGIKATGTVDLSSIAVLNETLEANFQIGILNLLPLLIVLTLSYRRVNSFITFGAGTGSAIVLSMCLQGYSFLENLKFIMSGFVIHTGLKGLDTLLNRGGLSSMLYLVGTIIICGMLSGLFTKMKILTTIVDSLSGRLHSPRGTLVGVACASAIMAIMGGQYPAITIPAVAFKGSCDELDIHRAVLGRTMQDVGTMIGALIPWNAWTIGYMTVLGTGSLKFIPFTFLCILSPLISLINIGLLNGVFRKNDQVVYRPLLRRQ
jgi:NhaC family Na+:H+ antiporter